MAKTIVNFINWLDETLRVKWDGEEYVFGPGERTKLEEGKARHFAKYAAMQHCNANGKVVSQVTDEFKQLVERGLEGQEEFASAAKAEDAVLNAEKQPSEDVKEEEEVFEGLEE